ncbi:hypothetical protein DPMN_035291 [Dreissena polymorpha]|uniref:Uncharacterized protein n=1 Tax=Dreissena polymorpha TaxID=45954 RepID=A0A9D4M8G7_DREPO|nr:hypothetical protein DPMN_035291 [Dreissena polymorpha]
MMFCVWFLTLLPTVFGFPPKSTCVREVPEFQYPCYVDVCTFPSQYCNQGERRCSQCTRYVCQQDRLPLACKYTCLKYDLVPSSMQNAGVTSASTKGKLFFSRSVFVEHRPCSDN